MNKKDPSSQFNWQELVVFLCKLFDQLQALLEKLFERGRTFARDFLERRKTEGPKHWHMTKKALLVLSHWHKSFDEWQESVQRVYTSVGEEIKRISK